MRQQLGVRPDLFTIGFIRRWAPAKDVPTLVHALRIIREHGIPFRAIFVGDKLDPGNFELMQLLRDNSCDGAVTLLGRRSDIPEIARAIDLHVLSSLVEAFPNIVAETMLSGTPNVVTDVGDSGLMVGDSGWVVPTRQPAKLANEIEMAYAEWNEDPERWQQRRLRARRLIADRFTFERMADEYERVWLEVVAAHRGSNE
jgi:glycosyltransferase involved in cell wall biosynthesis